MANHELPPSKLLKPVVRVEDIPVDGKWAYEEKFDGHRGRIIIDDDVKLLSRNGFDRTHRRRFYPAYSQARRAVKGNNAVLDGEYIGLRADGSHDLSTLYSPETKLVLVVFDVLRIRNRTITEESWDYRHDVLQDIFAKQPNINESPVYYIDNLVLAFEALKRKHAEGLVAKRRASKYRQVGESRDGDWLKWKFPAGV